MNSEENRLFTLLSTPHSVLDSSFSSKHDEEDTKYLIHILNQELNFSESQESYRYKSELLLKLKYIIRKWVETLYESTYKSQIKDSNDFFKGDLIPFGSYILKSYTKDSDLDTVCIVPSFIKREEDFFGLLYEIFYKHPNVKELMAIKETSVPLLKMKFYDVQIDILFAQLNVQASETEKFPLETLIHSGEIFLFIDDEKSFTSINGIRGTSCILKSVPNIQNFQMTLKYVKLWAKTHDIYSNLMGYLGGVSWAILVAKICQLYPNYQPSKLLERFFMVYYRWEWEELAIKIEEINEEIKVKYMKSFFLKELDHENVGEKYFMNILMPCYPFRNSSYTVTHSSLSVIRKHLKLAVFQISQIKQGFCDWKVLFEKPNFFEEYDRFLRVNLFEIKSCENHQIEECNFKKWQGILESKLRKLTKELETNIINTFLDICLFPTPFVNNEKIHKNSIVYYYGLKFKNCILAGNPENEKYLNLTPFVAWFIENLERNEKIPKNINVEFLVVKREKIDKKHLKLNENRGNVQVLLGKKSKLGMKIEKSGQNSDFLDTNYWKGWSFCEKMIDFELEKNSLFSYTKQIKHIF